MRPLDDLRIDAGGEFAGAAIDFDDALDVGLHLGAGEHGARLDLGFLGEVLVGDLGIALEHHLVDDGIFDHLDGQGAGGIVEIDPRGRGEQAGGEQGLERLVDLGGIVDVAFAQIDVGQHRAGLDPLGAPDHDMLDDALRGAAGAAPRPARPGWRGRRRDRCGRLAFCFWISAARAAAPGRSCAAAGLRRECQRQARARGAQNRVNPHSAVPALVLQDARNQCRARPKFQKRFSRARS